MTASAWKEVREPLGIILGGTILLLLTITLMCWRHPDPYAEYWEEKAARRAASQDRWW